MRDQISSARLSQKKSVIWVVFLCYGPLGFFAMTWFRQGLFAINAYSLIIVFVPAMISWLSAILALIIYLFRAPRKMFLPAVLCMMNYVLLFTPLQKKLNIGGFEAFISPEPVFVQKHCAPINFIQDTKTYSFGACDLKLDPTGQIEEFSWIYDTSGDIAKYDQLSTRDRRLFTFTMRKYFHNDQTDPFEDAYFTAERYDLNFYDIMFDEADAEGFTKDYGPPP